MNRAARQVEATQLSDEKACIEALEKAYKAALKDINRTIKQLQSRPQTQSVVYQLKYQQNLRSQISAILDNMRDSQYATLNGYLNGCYQNGYIGSMYEIAQQGIPVTVPIDHAQVVKAVKTNAKLSRNLYSHMGKYLAPLKKAVTQELSRGLASSMHWQDIARNIEDRSRIGFSNAVRIARTEGHRIQNAAGLDAAKAAKGKGADIVLQWDATLDGATRDSHRKLDGQIVEVGEKFHVGNRKADAPGHFGRPEEDINCRCRLNKRARWALDEDELKTLKQRAEFYGLDKSDTFKAFREKFLKMEEIVGDQDPEDVFTPKTLAGVKRGKPMTRNEADGGKPNPNFDKGGGYHINCQTCVVAYEARLRGYDVAAKPNTRGSMLEKVSRRTNLAWIDPETGEHPEYIKNEKAKNAKSCAKWLRETVEEGKRYTIEFSWKGRGNGGHIISLDRDSKGRLRLYDPQCGQTYTDKIREVENREWRQVARIRGEDFANGLMKRYVKVNPFESYLSRFKYFRTLTGIKFYVGPELLQVSDMMFDEEVCGEILTKGVGR